MIEILEGGQACDDRGRLRFFNGFDMSPVKRFYIISNSSNEIIRGWRGHKIEQRWFYVLSGSFKIDVVLIDNWISPSKDLEIITFNLDNLDNSILHLCSGYATSIQSTQLNSELLVLSDYSIDNSKLDDFSWDANYFKE